ncbi:RNA 3'-terminal phosphate cyclase [Janthinobacterium agaricidamnosum]|uniref:RNA 3'-terminal phosphate cyclase domain protein n=1 Tax=Janthinobacterium agaricidamnosum NBRC 102515 = DSM 9628 TaxID=1349767 RepID=W0UWT7_9BURK|nr:RNA 3'-terminal phosphate cyclase [Janthinobacterium agaricidamnosum]CDG80919.1 RNA 3'-terminal phosphate cyclase domain protein [Janthinobacterium agaricidamnosum NBRC 102515 = DSM 9628]
MIELDCIASGMDWSGEQLRARGLPGEHLADQLPMALAGGGAFITSCVSQHALTNAEVIGKFLPVRITFEDSGRFSTCIVKT